MIDVVQITPGKRLLRVNSEYLPVFTVLFLGFLNRLVFANGLFFDQSLQTAKSAWYLFSFESLNDGSLPSVLAQGKEFLQEANNLPNEYRPLSIALGLIYKLFGVNDTTSILPSLVASILAGLLVYLLAKSWFGAATGLLACFFWASLPIDIFLSISLLPVVPLIFGSLLAIYLFDRASKVHSWPIYLGSFLIVLLGLTVDWTFYLPTVFFLGYLFLQRFDLNFKKIERILWVVALACIFLSQIGGDAIDLYNLFLLVFDSFLILPLLLLSLVYAARVTSETPLRLVLLWLAIKAAFIFIAAPWIAQRPIVSTIGMSGYWLDLMLPALILISWQFGKRVGLQRVKSLVFAISPSGLFGLLIFYLIPSSFLNALLTASRISVGLTFFCVFLYLAFWNKRKTRSLLFAALIIFFLLATPSIVNTYVESYSYSVKDSGEVVTLLSTFDGDIQMFIGDESIYERFLYLSGYQPAHLLNATTTLTLDLLSENRPESVPVGSYILFSDDYLKFVLGTTPSTWSIVKEISSSDQQKLFLYQVLAQE